MDFRQTDGLLDKVKSIATPPGADTDEVRINMLSHVNSSLSHSVTSLFLTKFNYYLLSSFTFNANIGDFNIPSDAVGNSIFKVEFSQNGKHYRSLEGGSVGGYQYGWHFQGNKIVIEDEKISGTIRVWYPKSPSFLSLEKNTLIVQSKVTQNNNNFLVVDKDVTSAMGASLNSIDVTGNAYPGNSVVSDVNVLSYGDNQSNPYTGENKSNTLHLEDTALISVGDRVCERGHTYWWQLPTESTDFLVYDSAYRVVQVDGDLDKASNIILLREQAKQDLLDVISQRAIDQPISLIKCSDDGIASHWGNGYARAIY